MGVEGRDRGEGLHPRAGAVAALIEGDPFPMQTQHLASRTRWRAVCGAFGQVVTTESGVTCEACRKALSKRAKARGRRQRPFPRL